MRLPFDVVEDTGAASETTPAGRTMRMVQRERVFILAASKDQADLFARRWASEGAGRARADVVYLSDRPSLDGWRLRPQDRIVALEGFWRNPNASRIELQVRLILAKTGHDWSAVENVVL